MIWSSGNKYCNFIMYFDWVIEWENRSFIFSIMIHSMGIKNNINGD